MTPTRNQRPPEPVQGAQEDHDLHYEFGRRPRTVAHFPFSTREFARLLVLRGRVRDGLLAVDDWRPPAHAPRATVRS